MPFPPGDDNPDVSEAVVIVVAVASGLFFLAAILFAVFLPRLPRWVTYLGCCCHCICCPTTVRRACRNFLDDSYAYGGYFGDDGDDDEFYIPDELRQSLFQNDAFRQSYELGRAFEAAHPYGSVATALTAEQKQMIMEKGVSAWQFDVSPDANCMPQMDDRTELIFYGGENCVPTNLPLPKQNPVYYFEVKLQEKPQETNVAVGLATKPYPSWRLAGWNKYSVGYHSESGRVFHNNPFRGINLGEPCFEGDIIGIGYQPRSGTVFFTRNGRRYRSVTSGLLYDLFPVVSADGYCVLSTNFGQRGFVFIEANVKRWGLAPLEGTIVPPPMYGQDQGTFLVESNRHGSEANGAGGSSAAAAAGPSSSASATTPYYNHHYQSLIEREAHAFAQHHQVQRTPTIHRNHSQHELPENPSFGNNYPRPSLSPLATEYGQSIGYLQAGDNDEHHVGTSPSSPTASRAVPKSQALPPNTSITIKGNNMASFVVSVPRFRPTSDMSGGGDPIPSSPASPETVPSPHRSTHATASTVPVTLTALASPTAQVDFAMPLASPPAYTERDPHPDVSGSQLTADDCYAQAQLHIADALTPNPRFEPTPPAYPPPAARQQPQQRPSELFDAVAVMVASDSETSGDGDEVRS
ncbi:Protein ssh4 [Tieghemiomyces parasiticus]|uniref:Protein ssh4 n=1 Tax=Tieghemiomyces parasiticus TaxID=78921 RepID=A0A9W8DYA8_9FUNG|nr:Protein ssh4 [Tieghemiomyces parasiticus]